MPFSWAAKNFLSKTQMCFNKMIITRSQVYLGFQLTEFLRESISSSRQSSRTLAHSQVVTFNERRVDVFAGRRDCQVCLQLLWITKDDRCFYRHNPSFLTFLYHPSIPQFWRWNQFWLWWSPFLTFLFGYLLNITIAEKCAIFKLPWYQILNIISSQNQTCQMVFCRNVS